jgi:hypothetical protein
MKKYQLLAAALITAPIVVLFALSSSVTGAAIPAKDEAEPVVFSASVVQTGYGEERPCPLDTKSGRIIVEFVASFQDGVLTTRFQSRNSLGPISVDIPAGTYNITLVSFDDHIEQPNEKAQKQESWFLQAQNGRGNITFESNAISDLPEDQNILEELVQEDVEITQDITQLLAKHLLDVGESEEAESVTPVCAAFDRVDDSNNNSHVFPIPETSS